MSDIIAFPNNYEGYVAKGDQYLLEGKDAEALDSYLKGYELQQTNELNLKIVTLLVKEQNFAVALRYVHEKITLYANKNNENAKLYETILFANHQYLTAALWQVEQTGSLNDVGFQQKIQVAKQKKSDDDLKKFAKIIKDYRYLGAQMPLAQMQWLKENLGYLLPTDFIRISRGHLIDENIFPLVKAEILSRLVALGETDVYQFLWLDEQIYEVDLSQLAKLEESHVLKELIALLQQESASEQPELSEMLQGEISLEVGFLYPFEAKVIQQPKLWLNVYQRSLFGETDFTEDEQTVFKWQQKLQLILLELSET